jgi:D-serine deaminase-like pyridoxal phosphate-dependent protein
MDSRYLVSEARALFSPGLLFYKEAIAGNLRRMVEIAGGSARLRPHVKTHKTREIVQMELELGITKHKCATLAEAEMLADCGVADIVIAYPVVGPNCGRLRKLADNYPASRFAVVADDSLAVEQLAACFSGASQAIDVLLDVNVGQNRTGIPPGEAAILFYEMLDRQPGVRPGGLHIYDGHNHQHPLAERQSAVLEQFEAAWRLRDTLLSKGLPIPRLVLGGTPTFPIHAKTQIPEAECSPGTCVLSDANYGQWFSDLDFAPAALLLTRVVSRPTRSRVTFDLGYKAVSPDSPAGSRCVLWDVPDAKAVLHNEEHLVVETPAADRFRPGDVVYAQPAHICPTVALHQFAYVIEDGKLVDWWDIVARDRVLQF